MNLRGAPRGTLLLLGGGVVLLVAFAALQLRRHDPLVDLRLLRDPTFLASVSGSLFTGVAIIGVMSYSPTLAQHALGTSGLGRAALLLAWSVPSVVVALGARRLPARIPSHVRLSAGLALATLGEVGLTGLSSGASRARLVPGLIVAGVASGVAIVVVLVSTAGSSAGHRGAQIQGWNLATLVCAALCLAGAVTAALCRARVARHVPEVS